MIEIDGAFLARHFGGAFRWGQADCCTAACNAFSELHGVDPMAHLRAAYTGRTEARELIEGLGGLMALCINLADRAGLAYRSTAAFRVGDIALVKIAGGQALGLALGDGRCAGKGPRGIAFVSDALGYWGPR